MNIDAQLSKVKLEDGDILLAKVDGDAFRNTPPSDRVLQLSRLRETLEGEIKRLGVEAVVLVVTDVDISIVKRNDLADVFQRLDDIERKLGER